MWSYPDDKPMNGAAEFGSVYGSNSFGQEYMNITDNRDCKTCAI